MLVDSASGRTAWPSAAALQQAAHQPSNPSKKRRKFVIVAAHHLAPRAYCLDDRLLEDTLSLRGLIRRMR